MNHTDLQTTEVFGSDTKPAFDLRSYLRVLWRWKWIFIAILVVIPVAVYVVVSREHKVYQSSTLLQINPITTSTSITAGGEASSAQVLNAVAALITTTPVADQAAKLLHPTPADPRTLLADVSANPNANTGFITVTASASTPQKAVNIATAFSTAVAVTRAQQAANTLTGEINEANQELAALPRKGSRIARRQLTSQVQQDKALRVAQGANAQIVQPALADRSPVSPHVERAVGLGLVAGLLLALFAVALAEAGDRRLRELDDLEELTDRPVLGVVPGSAFSDQIPTFAEIEAFRTLHASLTYFNVDTPTSTLVITSPGKGDGKTTVATQLAIAAARAGSDVILIDTDLRHPQLADRLGIKSGIGLETVLSGQAELTDALIDYELRPKPQGGRLRVLAAFDVAPNPAQLLASHSMRGVLDRVAAMCDSVIVDTSPALLVADAFPLFSAASGVVVIARMNRTFKQAIVRLQWTIENANGQLLGTVATDAERRGPYGRYADAYGYGGDAKKAADDQATTPASAASSSGATKVFRGIGHDGGHNGENGHDTEAEEPEPVSDSTSA